MKLIFIFAILALVNCQKRVDPYCGPNATMSGECSCHAGYYGTNEEASSKVIGCKRCPNNTFTNRFDNIGGVEKCTFCDYGFYVSEEANNGKPSVCSACPDNTTSQSYSSFSNGKENCAYCKAGYYNSSEDKGQLKCLQCPSLTTTDEEYDYTDSYSTIQYCNYCVLGYYPSADQKAGEAVICSKCPKNSTTYKQVRYGGIDSCQCDDLNAARLSETNNECKCRNGYEGLATKESPCIKIKDTSDSSKDTQKKESLDNKMDESSGELLNISFFLILFVFSI